MRAFVAVWPSDDVVATVASLARADVRGVRWTSSDQWHVTLHFFGSVDDGMVPEIAHALDDVAARFAPVEVAVGPATATFGRSILHVPVSGLSPVAAATVEAVGRFGSQAPESRPFAGHLTLARSRDRRTDLRRLAGTPLAASWTASELTLVQSQTARDGAQSPAQGAARAHSPAQGAARARYQVIHRCRLVG